MPFLLFLSLYFDRPEQLSDVISTASIAEDMRSIHLPGLVLSWGWVAVTSVALLQWILLRRAIVVLDLFLQFAKANTNVDQFWEDLQGRMEASDSRLDNVTGKAIKLLHHKGYPKNHIISSRIILISFLQVLLVMAPGFPVICWLSGVPRLIPAIAYYCAFLLVIHISAVLSIFHLAMNAGKHWTCCFAFIPAAILGFAISGNGITSVIVVAFLIASFWWGVVFIMHQFWRLKKTWLVSLSILGFVIIGYFWSNPGDWNEANTIFTKRDRISTPFKAVSLEDHRPPADQPAVVLCLGGGGSRAAIFNGIILERLWWIHPEGLSQEATDYMDGLAPALREIVRREAGGKVTYYPGRLLLIHAGYVSSVSGGSLTSAYWSTRTIREGVAVQAKTALERRAKALSAVFGEIDRFSSPLDDRDLVLPRPMGKDEDLWWQGFVKELERNAMVTAMRKNFLAAVICGAFDPLSSRVDKLTRMWETQFDWRDARKSESDPVLHRLSDFRQFELEGLVPHSIFNTTRTKNGERMAVTNLQQNWFERRRNFGVDPDQVKLIEGLRFNTSPGRITTHSWFDRFWDPTIAHSVFASSDFPFGFPVHEFIVEPKKEDGSVISSDVPEGSLDGGILDNTGANTVVALMRKLATGAKDDDWKDGIGPLQKAFVLQIDTSELPSDPGRPWELLFNIYEARNTMSRVERVQEQSMLDYLVSEFGGLMNVTATRAPHTWQGMFRVNVDTSAKKPKEHDYVFGFEGEKWGWYNIRAGEFEGEHVPTSWHLDEDSRQVLYKLAFSEVVTRSIQGSSIAFVHLLAGKRFEYPDAVDSPALFRYAKVGESDIPRSQAAAKGSLAK